MDEKKRGALWEYTKTKSGTECPVCHELVDYLLGEDTRDGGVQGCERCWKPTQGTLTAGQGEQVL